MSTTTTIHAESHVSAAEAIPLESIRPRRDAKNAPAAILEPAVENAETGSDEPPLNAQGETERWNYPKANIPRLGFCFVSFIVAGMNDAATGV